MMRTFIVTLFFFNSLFSLAQMVEEEVILTSKPGNLYGTLLVPENTSSTVAIIIPGSGPTDRDGNTIGAKGKNNSLKYLAENLAVSGIPSLRIDKRGVGKSTSAALAEKDLRFDTYVNDVIDWGFQILNDVRFKKLVIIGHSEGSLIGMIAAQELEIAGYVSLAGSGYPIDQIIKEQMRNQSDEIKTEVEEIFKELKDGKEVNQVSSDLLAIFRPSIQPYFISWLKYNPTKEIQKLSSPVLIVNGTTDIQVSVDNAEALHQAKPESTIEIIDGMNHVFKEAPENRTENIATYTQPELKNIAELNIVLTHFIKQL